MVICLEQGADCLHTVQLMLLHPKTPSSLPSFKSRLVLPFWYRLTQIVLEKRQLNACTVVVVVTVEIWHVSFCKAVRLVALKCYTPFTLLYFTLLYPHM